MTKWLWQGSPPSTSIFSCQSSFHQWTNSSITIPEMCDKSNQLACYHNSVPQFELQLWPGTLLDT
jgi:hypothetical protein